MLTDELAAVLKRQRLIDAHHEAGHAVAAVMRGGVVHHIKLGDSTDAGLIDPDRESVGVTRHTSTRNNQPFVAFAGPWAEWRVRSQLGEAEEMDLWEWLDTDRFVNDFGDPYGDYAMMDYHSLSAAQIEVWVDELERHWPAIVAVAALAVAGAPVDTEVVVAAIDNG